MGTVTSSDQIHFNLMLVSLDSGLVLIFLLFNHTLLKQGNSIEGVLQPHASLQATFPFTRSNFLREHFLQVAA